MPGQVAPGHCCRNGGLAHSSCTLHHALGALTLLLSPAGKPPLPKRPRSEAGGEKKAKAKPRADAGTPERKRRPARESSAGPERSSKRSKSESGKVGAARPSTAAVRDSCWGSRSRASCQRGIAAGRLGRAAAPAALPFTNLPACLLASLTPACLHTRLPACLPARLPADLPPYLQQMWSTLEHGGVLFPPEYVPHGVKMLYDGVPVDLTPEQEEVASFFAAMKDSGEGGAADACSGQCLPRGACMSGR